MSSRTTAALVALSVGLWGSWAQAFSSHAEVDLAREFSPSSALPGQQVTVRLTVQAGAIGADPIRGLIVSEHIPAGMGPTPGEVLLDGQAVAALGETVAEDLIEPGCVTWRWVLETPPDFAEGLALAADGNVQISYQVTVPGDAVPGSISFPGATWIGMIAAQADAGDNYGYEEGPALLGVEAAGDDQDADGMPDTWETDHGLDPGDPSDAGTDLDGDGFSNLEEFQAGTDPTDPDSHPDRPNEPPEVSTAAEPTQGEAPLLVQFSAPATDTDGTVVNWSWDFGDGSDGQGADPEHTYTQAGSFVARVTVTDDQGATASDTVSIMVFESIEPDPDPEVIIEGGCGCVHSGGAGAGWVGLGVLVLLPRRRRNRPDSDR